MVPEGWIRSQISEIANVQVGRDLVEERFSEVQSDKYKYPVYSNTVEARGLYGFYDFPEYPGNAVTVVGRGIGLGRAFARDKNDSFGAIGRLLVLTPKNNSFDVGFLADYINFSLQIHNESGGIPQLPGSSLSKYLVTLPPLPEQKKITQILSTWDKAIATTEQLLANSQQQKKALMQQLLTGKKRLRDARGIQFKSEWNIGHLSDISKISKGKALSSKDLVEGQYPVIAGGKASPYKHHAFTHEGVITVSASGAYAGYVAYHPYKIWASDCSVVEDTAESHIDFIYHLMSFLQVKIYSLQSGGAQPHVYPKDLLVLKVQIPSFEEQQRIADLLSTADKEINALQQKVNKLKREKKALMQQLLTGKRKVKIEETA